jgi:hypothetical protein
MNARTTPRYSIQTALTLDPTQMDYLLIEWGSGDGIGREIGQFASIEAAMVAAHKKLLEAPRLVIEN